MARTGARVNGDGSIVADPEAVARRNPPTVGSCSPDRGRLATAGAATVVLLMRHTPSGEGRVAVLTRPHRVVSRLGGGVPDEVLARGFAHVRGALAADERRALLDGAATARNRFLALPDRVNGVDQSADQLTLRVGDPHHESVNRLAAAVVDAVAGWPAEAGLAAYRPSEARYMRYTGDGAGLGAHVDGKFYRLLVCVFSLVGSARFRVVADQSGPAADVVVEPGDLLLLRAPGLGGAADGRRRHAVGPPLDGDARISLTLRMVGGARSA